MELNKVSEEKTVNGILSTYEIGHYKVFVEANDAEIYNLYIEVNETSLQDTDIKVLLPEFTIVHNAGLFDGASYFIAIDLLPYPDIVGGKGCVMSGNARPYKEYINEVFEIVDILKAKFGFSDGQGLFDDWI